MGTIDTKTLNQHNKEEHPVLNVIKPEPNEALYNIPLHYRKMENLHIVFWLFKDVAWCMVWKPLGIIMIFPTLIVSILIAWRTREYVSELCHNLSITVWITASLLEC
jgi:hypothetical protein